MSVIIKMTVMQGLMKIIVLMINVSIKNKNLKPLVKFLFVKPTCSERDIVATTSVRCVCVVCMHSSGFVQSITCTFVLGFQNKLAQLFSLKSRSAI